MSCPFAGSGVAQSRPAATAPETRGLAAFLFEIAQRYDIYFTLETKQPSEGTQSAVELVRFSSDDAAKISSADDAINALRAKLEGAEVVRDEWNPAVIRIVEKAVAGLPGYAIEQRVTINFRGTLDGVVDRLQKELEGSIRLPSVFILPAASMGDPFTSAEIAATGLEIRQVLTDYVPLSAYNRILWKAETYIKGGKPTSVVTYSGKRLVPSFAKAQPGKLHPSPMEKRRT